MTGGLAHPNGVGLSPDGKRLWVSEHLANRLLALDLEAVRHRHQRLGAPVPA